MALKISELVLMGALTGLVILMVMTAKIKKDPDSPVFHQRSEIVIEEID